MLWFCCATKLGFSEDICGKEVILLLLLSSIHAVGKAGHHVSARDHALLVGPSRLFTDAFLRDHEEVEFHSFTLMT